MSPVFSFRSAVVTILVPILPIAPALMRPNEVKIVAALTSPTSVVSAAKVESIIAALVTQTRDVSAEFGAALSDWKNATQSLSSLTEAFANPAYLRIVALGAAVVPLILREFRREADHWHAALQAITGGDPVTEDHAGDLDGILADWLDWANKRDIPV